MASQEVISDPQIVDEYRWNLLRKNISERNAARAFTIFRDAGIEPILIKGLAAGRYYPDNEPRIFIDLDLSVASADFAKATRIVRSEAADGLAIDLHRELRHLDSVPWDDLYENSREIELGGGMVRVLRPEDHLRVLCVHWLTDGGSNRDRLRDIYYAVTNRDADFDWDRLLNIVTPTRRRWIVCTLGLASKFLGLDLSGTPVSAAVEDLPGWLADTVEKEWAADVKFVPLEVVIARRENIMQQLGRRLWPNPVWATVQAEGSFDAPTRVHYQIANIVRRIIPSYRRVTSILRATESK